LGMVPWSQCPIRRISLFEGCSARALRCERWCSHAANIFDTFEWILWCLRTS
jgi:hypothetical protein